jgi:hypothetical protein
MTGVSNDVIEKIIKIVNAGGGEVYEQPGYINFFAVRSYVTNDTFNDALYIYWKESDGSFKCVTTNGFTTKPGKRIILNENGKQHKDGAAILKEGWQKDIWHIGKHQNKYTALRSTGGITNPTVITRDPTQYGKRGSYEFRVFEDRTYSGHFGVNFHKSANPGRTVNGYSAGCQVFQQLNEFEEMLAMAKAATSKGQETFSYFLTNENVFGGDGTANADGTPFDFSNSQFAGMSVSSGGSSSSSYSGGVSGLGSSGSGDGESGTRDQFASYTSFGVETIFGKVFPDDDNNRYIEMPSEDAAIIQYSEPVLKVDELNISTKSLASMGVNPDKISYFVPVVYVNDFMIPQTNITNFCLDYTSFVPQVMVEFADMTNELLSTNVPKPGSYVKVFVGGYGDEKYYKPIRQDFVITNINKTNKTGGEYQNYHHGNPIKYRITGILNVPLGLRKMPWSSSKINARQAMFNLSNTVGLGFATNFNTNSNVDVMRWVNTQNKSYYDFMKDITQHSCYSPYTFFTSFIDQYYVLNYVECRRLLTHGGKKTDMPQMIYNSIMPDMEKNTEATDENLNSGDQKVSYYFLSNDSQFRGWSNYIEEYFELNDGYAVMSDGYRKTLTYSDKCGVPDLTSKNYKFLLTPIDNLQRDSNKNIVSLPNDITYDTYIPLNLRQTTNSAYVDNQSIYDAPTIAESTVDLGEVDTSNNFPLYFYAAVQNDFQMKSLKKCGLSVRLQNYNPAITRFSRIWVDIYDTHDNSKVQIRKNDTVNDMPDSTAKDYLKNKNENIIIYKEDTQNDNDYQVYNRSLSGWYVVTDMKISYNTVKDFKGNSYKKLQSQLTLNRVEYKPSFHSEYNIAKKAIEKYRGDNLAENIMCGGDTV